jgi:hypothetical protein
MAISYLSIDSSPDDVRMTGVHISALSEGLTSKASGLASTISSLESGQPWGNDKFGEAFKKSYFQQPAGSDQQFNEALKSDLSTIGDQLQKVGDGISGAMDSYQLVDGVSAQDIGRSRPV